MTVEEAAIIEAKWALEKTIAPEDVNRLITSEHELRLEVARLRAMLEANSQYPLHMCLQAAAAERERCAKVVEETDVVEAPYHYQMDAQLGDASATLRAAAAAIRGLE